MEAQHTIEWYRKRLGCITGSECGVLMKSGRNGCFSDAAKTYIYQIAGERFMDPDIINDDYTFEIYLQQVNVNSKAMQWGNEQEEYARNLYAKKTGLHIIEVGSCKHPTIPNFASSPDGFFYDEDSQIKLCLEIKCLDQGKFMRYKSDVHDNDSLLEMNPKYFYQCCAHMMCTGAQGTDFVVYNPFQIDPIHIVQILPDERVFAEMENRIRMADDIINQIADIE